MRMTTGWMVGLLVAASLGAGAKPSLIDAVKASDVAAVKRLISDQKLLKEAGEDGSTALHYAVFQDNQVIVDLLLRAGADAKAVNDYGVTPIALASENGNAALIERLLEAGVNANTASPAGETALMTAARTGKVDAVKLLLEKGADVNARESSNGQTALMWASVNDNLAVVNLLIEKGADVKAHALGSQAAPAAMSARVTSRTVQPRPKSTFTPLFYAVRAGHLDVTKALIKAGADINEVLPDGNTPLMIALLNANWNVASELLDAGADPKADKIGWTPLHQLAIARRPNNYGGINGARGTGGDSLEVIKKLVAKGANINARMTRDMNTGQRNKFFRIGATPFLLAGKSCDYQQMKVLADLGADPKLTNEVGDTAMMVAAGLQIWNPGEDAGTDADCLEAVKLAHKLGIDINAKNEWDETALIGSAVRGAVPIIDYLVENGADLQWKSKRGWTAWGVANGIFYSNHLIRQAAAEERLKEILTARGISTKGMETDLSNCVGCSIGNRRVEDDRRYREGYKPADLPTDEAVKAVVLQPQPDVR